MGERVALLSPRVLYSSMHGCGRLAHDAFSATSSTQPHHEYLYPRDAEDRDSGKTCSMHAYGVQ